jgi:hypothetical protein
MPIGIEVMAVVRAGHRPEQEALLLAVLRRQNEPSP